MSGPGAHAAEPPAGCVVGSEATPAEAVLAHLDSLRIETRKRGLPMRWAAGEDACGSGLPRVTVAAVDAVTVHADAARGPVEVRGTVRSIAQEVCAAVAWGDRAPSRVALLPDDAIGARVAAASPRRWSLALGVHGLHQRELSYAGPSVGLRRRAGAGHVVGFVDGAIGGVVRNGIGPTAIARAEDEDRLWTVHLGGGLLVGVPIGPVWLRAGPALGVRVHAAPQLSSIGVAASTTGAVDPPEQSLSYRPSPVVLAAAVAAATVDLGPRLDLHLSTAGELYLTPETEIELGTTRTVSTPPGPVGGLGGSLALGVRL